jgi:sugar O-acyltransferase (sialic acid O-acetyltransferase NeuD family)
MTRNAIVFGTGGFAEVVDFYLARDSDYRVVAFTATADAVGCDQFLSRPVLSFDEIAANFAPETHEMFVAVGYARLNALRERFCCEARAKGYRLLTYVCSKATWWGDTKLGDNVFIFEDNTIQPFVTIGNGTILWSGNHVGHHSSIGSYCFVTSHVVISGYCRIGDRCFLGVNSTVADDTSIGDDNIIGPGALVQKNTEAGEAYISERTKKFPKESSRFFR